jgi:dipeptidyl-peptidase-4
VAPATDREKVIVNALRPPEIVRFPNPAFDLDLYGALFRPDAAKYGPGPYPTIVSVYGGPHVQVKNATALHIYMFSLVKASY